MPFQIVINSSTSIDIKDAQWDDINIIMMGLYTAKRTLESRIRLESHDLYAISELKRVDRVIDNIQDQYSNWSGSGIGVLESVLADTLKSAGIHSNKETIINQ